MSDKLYCTYCGALNEAGAIFCERCGHELEPIDVPAKDTKPAAEQDDLLTVLMEEPVTQIPDEPAAPVKKTAAAADTGRADADVLNENTQLFSRTELNAAIAASEAQKGTAAAQKEAELARQKERLIEAGFDVERPSFSSLLGIGYYLTEDEFEKLIAGIASLSCEGASICLDYPINEEGRESARNRELAAAAGEAMKARYSYGEMEALLSRAGFLIYDHMDADEATEAFFKDSDMTAPAGVGYCLAVRK